MKKIFHQTKQNQSFLLRRMLKTRGLLFIPVLTSLLILSACSSYRVEGIILVNDQNTYTDFQNPITSEKDSTDLLEPTPEWPDDVLEEELLDPGSDIEAILKDLDIPEGCDFQLDPEFEIMIFEMINEERINKGLEPLTINEKLQKAARQHSVDMACNNYFNHTDLNGNSYDARVMEQGYQFAAVGENIYAGDNRYNSPEQAYRGWYKSQRHYEVMFHELVTEIGIGYAYNPESRYGGYFTADFAKPVADGGN